MIFDSSAPHHSDIPSINNLFLPPSPFSLSDASNVNNINLIKKAGPGAWLSKAIITIAFKVRPFTPNALYNGGMFNSLLGVVAPLKYSTLFRKLFA